MGIIWSGSVLKTSGGAMAVCDSVLESFFDILFMTEVWAVGCVSFSGFKDCW